MTSRTAELDFDLVRRLRAQVRVPLVLHGSSGVSDEGIARAVRSGLTKINVGTQLNIAFTSSVRAELDGSERPDPRPALTAARTAMADVVARLIEVVSSPST